MTRAIDAHGEEYRLNDGLSVSPYALLARSCIEGSARHVSGRVERMSHHLHMSKLLVNSLPMPIC
jgi:hypothetical protein